MDFHSHFLFPPPRRVTLPAAERQYEDFLAAGGVLLVHCTVDWEGVEGSLEFAAAHDRVVLSCGWAPQTVTYGEPARVEREFEAWLSFVKEHPEDYACLGEVGVDFHHARTRDAREKQLAAFHRVLRETRHLGKPYVLHVRNPAASDADPSDPDDPFNEPDAANRVVLEVLSEEGVEAKRVAWHCFSGPPGAGRELAEAGFTLSVPSSAYGFERWRRNVVGVPLSSLVTETDSYYQHPTKRGPFNVPANAAYAVAAVAHALGIDQREVAESTTRNALRFLGLEDPREAN